MRLVGYLSSHFQCALVIIIIVNYTYLDSLFRETIMRLVSEVGQEKKSANQSQEAISALTRERDVLQQTIREREIETDRLKNQLAASQDAWSVTKNQLDEKQNK